MLHDGVWRLLGLALVGLTLTSIIGLLQRTGEMSNLPWQQAFSALPLVLSKTHYGMTWLVRMAGVVVLWFGWWRLNKGIGSVFPGEGRKLSPFVAFLYAMMLAMASVAWSVSASSHAADWGDFTLPEWTSWLHIMVGSAWLGGILAFALVIGRRLREPSERTQALFAVCAGRLSRLAGIALSLVLATAAYNVWRQLDRFSDLWSSGYGEIILAKLVLVGLVAVIGASSRYFNLPFLCRETGGSLPAQRTRLPLRILRRLPPSWRPGEGPDLTRQFGYRVTTAAWLTVGVLICAALLGHTMPPGKHVDAVRVTTGTANVLPPRRNNRVTIDPIQNTTVPYIAPVYGFSDAVRSAQSAVRRIAKTVTRRPPSLRLPATICSAPRCPLIVVMAL